MLSEALAGLPSQYCCLMEMLFLETLARPQGGRSNSGLEPGSIGFTRQKRLQHLRWRLAERGFRPCQLVTKRNPTGNCYLN